ncbi:MAG: CcmD family protein [Chloroflexi bacterium]|nr:CcmD family protein [Chloroflexota bacterium]
MQNAGFFFAAFIVIWAIVFGYVFVLIGRQRRLSQELAALKEEVELRNKTG